MPIIFDIHDECHMLEFYLRQRADDEGGYTLNQIFIRGHRDTPYFIPCFEMEI